VVITLERCEKLEIIPSCLPLVDHQKIALFSKGHPDESPQIEVNRRPGSLMSAMTQETQPPPEAPTASKAPPGGATNGSHKPLPEKHSGSTSGTEHVDNGGGGGRRKLTPLPVSTPPVKDQKVPQLSSLGEDEEDVEPMEEDTPEANSSINTNTPKQDCKTVKANGTSALVRDADKTTDSNKTLPKDQQAAKLTNS